MYRRQSLTRFTAHPGRPRRTTARVPMSIVGPKLGVKVWRRAGSPAFSPPNRTRHSNIFLFSNFHPTDDPRLTQNPRSHPVLFLLTRMQPLKQEGIARL